MAQKHLNMVVFNQKKCQLLELNVYLAMMVTIFKKVMVQVNKDNVYLPHVLVTQDKFLIQLAKNAEHHPQPKLLTIWQHEIVNLL
jgi:hypothetical protein